jgi:nitrile hydratase accessory protein
MSSFEAPAQLNLPGQQNEPVFLEPWHAEVFSLAVALNRKGVFSWNEWVEVFSSVSQEIPADPGESAETTYYRRWLAALERLVAYRKLASNDEMAVRKREWRRAYLRTPHGQPVALERGLESDEAQPHHGISHAHSHATHHQAARPEPIAISAARVVSRNSRSSTPVA